MTLNLVMSVILRYFTEIGRFRGGGNYVNVTVFEVRPTLSATILYPKESSFSQSTIYGNRLRSQKSLSE